MASLVRFRLAARSFSTTRIPRKDFVQELYLSQIKNYKPSASAQNISGVKDFSQPQPPKAPEVPSAQDLSKEMQHWESVQVGEVAGASSGPTSEETGSQSIEEYLSHLEADHPPPAAH